MTLGGGATRKHELKLAVPIGWVLGCALLYRGGAHYNLSDVLESWKWPRMPMFLNSAPSEVWSRLRAMQSGHELGCGGESGLTPSQPFDQGQSAWHSRLQSIWGVGLPSIMLHTIAYASPMIAICFRQCCGINSISFATLEFVDVLSWSIRQVARIAEQKYVYSSNPRDPPQFKHCI